MLLKALFAITIFGSLLVETTIIPFPFVVIFCVLLFAHYPNPFVLLTIFITTLILDILRVQHLGITPGFTLILLTLVILYERAVNTRDFKFVFLIASIGALIYGQMNAYDLDILQYIGIFVFVITLYYLFRERDFFQFNFRKLIR